jgi:hypothetical protein
MKLWLVPVVAAGSVWAADNSCPAYPPEKRQAIAWSLDLARASREIPKTRNERAAVTNLPPAINFIDDLLFAKMVRDNVQPAPLADDAMFLRRAYLDLTGRIPTPEQVDQFLQDTTPSKRTALIDRLMASDAFIDQWTLYFARRFQVTSAYYNYVSVPARNAWFQYLRDSVRQDRPWNDLATEVITASGDSLTSGPTNFILRQIQDGDPIQDTWDAATNTITTQFLGVQTQCISCHDGRRHLEQINLYLTDRVRTDFMSLSAYLARMNIVTFNADSSGGALRAIITDLPEGVYHGSVNNVNPGQRPPRLGVYEAVYLFDGQPAQTDEWRKEFARALTADRQFARAAVNYLWAYFFRTGIVDPADSWDLSRQDPANPPPEPFDVQPTHPELLERLADFFIQNGYRFKPLIRLMAASSAYQLSSYYPGQWRPEYARYFAKQTPRRLTAEEAYDAMVLATQTPALMNAEGFLEPLAFAQQLPDPTEPRDNGNVQNFLRTLGRGDWYLTPVSTESTVIQALYLMNDTFLTFRTFGNRQGRGNTRVALLMASPMSDEEAVTQLFLATLGRPPSAGELKRSIAERPVNRFNDREVWLSDIQWALLNKAEFLFLQ